MFDAYKNQRCPIAAVFAQLSDPELLAAHGCGGRCAAIRLSPVSLRQITQLKMSGSDTDADFTADYSTPTCRHSGRNP